MLQGPFYQRLRVELQIGYAVFSGIRQINGQTGLLFGVQSPTISLDGIVQQLQAFLGQLPSLIERSPDLGNQALAQQFAAQTLPINEAADLLWHAHLAGHSSGYLDQIQQLIKRARARMCSAPRNNSITPQAAGNVWPTGRASATTGKQRRDHCQPCNRLSPPRQR